MGNGQLIRGETMEKSLNINNIFESIQGEGKYAGTPVLFIRTAGCNLRCPWCDTAYAFGEGDKMSVDTVAEKIDKSNKFVVVWTGGEPLMQGHLIKQVRKKVIPEVEFHAETNGTYLNENLDAFNYVCFSPKKEMDAANVQRYAKKHLTNYDIKVVTDLNSVGSDMLNYATMLMPLTTFSKDDQRIKRRVWNYCVKKDIKYTPRLHVDVWGKERGR